MRRRDPPAAGPAAPRCPACGKPAAFSQANRFRPFCSERCRTSDLGAWAAERYRIPADPASGRGEPGDDDPGAARGGGG